MMNFEGILGGQFAPFLGGQFMSCPKIGLHKKV